MDSDSAVRELVGHLLDQRAEARAARTQIAAATPRQFREDMIALLHRLDEEARTERLPRTCPGGGCKHAGLHGAGSLDGVTMTF